MLVSTAALPVLAAGDTAPPAIASITLAKVEYWHKDQLGSLITTTDHTGAVTARYAWDPFGKRRLTNGTYDAAGALVIDWKPTLNWGTDRGFTGHEQLDDIGLVHMNGRIYDAALGRFLQADPMLQTPGDLQSFNRYAYCLNNPLNCTDPSGQTFFLTSAWKHFWHNPDMRLVASIAVSFALAPGGGALLQSLIADAVAQTAVAGFVSGAVASGTFKGAVQGSFTAVVFYAVGTEFGEIRAANGAVDPALLGQAVAAHAVAGCVTNVTGGGKCGPGALSAAFSKLATPITGQINPVAGTVVSAVIGGTAAELGGGKFANGAVTGAFGYLFNDLMHITGGMREGTNPFGHSALAVEGAGIFSYGNSTPLGSDPLAYITAQSELRDQQITIIPATAEQDAAALKYFLGKPGMNSVGIIDNCVVRCNEALGAAGIQNNAAPFPGSLARETMRIPGAQTYYIPKGGQIPQLLIDTIRQRFTPPNGP